MTAATDGTDGARSWLSSLAGQFGVDVGAGDPGQIPQFYADPIRSREILGGVGFHQRRDRSRRGHGE